MDGGEKREIIQMLAQQDALYSVYKKHADEATQEFFFFAESQPEDVKKMLFHYAHDGRKMYLRELRLACEYMEFLPEVKEHIADLEAKKKPK